MRVALVHDWLTGMRGGEKVLERIAAMHPGAPIHTLLWVPGSISPALERHPIRTSFLQSLPAVARAYRWYLPLFPAAIESFDLRGFDVVISNSHAVAKGARAAPGAFHLSYVLTPMRYVWDLEQEYFGHHRGPLAIGIRAATARLRVWDRATAARPQALVTLSRHVAARIQRHWGREAEVVAPPVDLQRFAPGPGSGDYYLLAGAFAPYKRGDLAIEACRRLGRRLVVVGSGQQEQAWRRLAGESVEFAGWVSDDALGRLYAGAAALLFPGEEDFGIVPVEAMASGCPVIAYGRGGALETVGRGAAPEALRRVAEGGAARVPGGVLFGAQTVEALSEAMRVLENEPAERSALRSRAEPFSNEAFDRGFEAALRRAYDAWRAGRPARQVDPVPS